jgi:type I restriction-modification system DNA methylase subunit
MPNQLSFLEMESAISATTLADLPIKQFREEEIKSQDISFIDFARVPDSEFSNIQKTEGIPTVKDIIKIFDKGLYRVNTHDFLSDVFECGAIAISNQFDKRNFQRREERYLSIIKKYEPDMQKLIVEVFTSIYLLLSNQINPDIGFNDYLGELYMKSQTSNSKAGQFFTPHHVSKLCAGVGINEAMVDEAIKQDKILTLHEPTCGAGGMVIAAVDVLYSKYHFNYSRNLLVECGDIDTRCVHMSYLQLGLAGIPAIIYHRNGLTLETWDRWETPAYIMQYTRFKNVFKGTVSDWHEKKE